MTPAPKPRQHALDHVHGGPDTLRIAFDDVGSSGGGATGFDVLFSVPNVISVFTGNQRWYPQLAGTVAHIHAALGTAPAGAGLTVNVKKNGTSIGTVTIAAGAHEASAAPSAAFVVGDYFTVDVTAVGSTTPGSDLVVQVLG